MYMSVLRVASGTEASILTDLAIRSKASWGYSSEFMEVFASELTINPMECEKGLVKVFDEAESVRGFYKLSDTAPTGELDFLFVEPDHQHRGIGKALYNEAISHAGALGIRELEIVADPNTRDFYMRMGAELISYSLSASIPDRLLPILRVQVAETP